MASAAVMYVTDLDRMVRFYAAIGLELEESKPGDYAVLNAAEFELSVIQSSRRAENASGPPQVREQTPIKLVFFVASIDETLEIVSAIGGRNNPASKRWRFRKHMVQDAIDPEGNVYQLREPS